MMLEEVHVKLGRITKLDLGPEMDVTKLRNEQRAREQEKVPAGAGRFCQRNCTLNYLECFYCVKEIIGLSVKMADVSG